VTLKWFHIFWFERNKRVGHLRSYLYLNFHDDESGILMSH